MNYCEKPSPLRPQKEKEIFPHCPISDTGALSSGVVLTRSVGKISSGLPTIARDRSKSKGQVDDFPGLSSSFCAILMRAPGVHGACGCTRCLSICIGIKYDGRANVARSSYFSTPLFVAVVEVDCMRIREIWCKVPPRGSLFFLRVGAKEAKVRALCCDTTRSGILMHEVRVRGLRVHCYPGNRSPSDYIVRLVVFGERPPYY